MFFENEFGKLHYKIEGKGTPVLMLHGFGPDHRLMSGCMEPLLRDKAYKRIYIDLPGMGLSKAYSRLETAEDMLAFLLQWIDQTIGRESFLLVGESYGGYLSRGILHKRPHQVEGVMLICPVVNPERANRRLPSKEVVIRDKDFLMTLEPEALESFTEMNVVQSQAVYKRFESEIVSGVSIADVVFMNRYQENGYSLPYDVDQLVYKKPVLILTGKQDHCTGYQDAFELLSQYPRASFSVLDRCGHNLQIEQSKLFSDLANDWLKRTLEVSADVC